MKGKSRWAKTCGGPGGKPLNSRAGETTARLSASVFTVDQVGHETGTAGEALAQGPRPRRKERHLLPGLQSRNPVSPPLLSRGNGESRFFFFFFSAKEARRALLGRQAGCV